MNKNRWHKLSLLEQMANIGSEVGRAIRWHGKDKTLFGSAFTRALELFDLTLDDPRWRTMRGRLKEIARAREFFCDTVLGRKHYNITPAALDAYFLSYAHAVRINR